VKSGWGLKPPLSIGAWLRFFVIKRLLAGLSRSSMLEIGVGTGSVSARLAAEFDVFVGVEQDAVSHSIAKSRIERAGGSSVLGVPEKLPAEAIFEIVGAFEVLEHFEDDQAALQSWRAHIKPDGWIILSVPAHPERFGPHDEMAGHFRRYRRQDLQRLLESAGFSSISVWSYGFPAGYLLEFARHRLAARKKVGESFDDRTRTSGRWLQPPRWAGFLTGTIGLPLAVLQGPFLRTEWGIGYVARGRKRRSHR
jgi:SAM-dependent methyltransferase